MTDFVSDTKSNVIDQKYRSRVFAQIYTYILSWPDPREQEAEPSDETIGGSTGGTAIEVPAIADVEPLFHEETQPPVEISNAIGVEK